MDEVNLGALGTEPSSLPSTPSPRIPAASPLSAKGKTVLWGIGPTQMGRPKRLALEVPGQIQMSPREKPSVPKPHYALAVLIMGFTFLKYDQTIKDS